ncbi:MAG: T9SS type A sorting domain-containing protein [Candidatus Kapaibacterium sp.]
MKNYLMILTMIFVGFSVLHSETIQIDLTPGYSVDVWYDFNGGVIKTEPTNNWDLAFQTNNQNAGILTNSHNGVKVWVVPDSHPDSWEMAIDTTGMAESWEEGFNSEESWSAGAVNLGKDGFVMDGDFGWGEYNMSTHGITGNKLFVLLTKDKEYKRFMVESLIAGTYTIRWAELDGTNEVMMSIAKKDYNSKLFTYLNVSSSEIIDREPALDEWALLFGKYIGMVQMGPEPVPYGLTGVRTNPRFRTAEVRDVPVNDAQAPYLNADSYSFNITEIGSDWKSFNNTTFTYEIVEDLTYFVTSDLDGTPEPVIHKIVFKSFEGSASGLLTFDLNAPTNVEDVDIVNGLNVFPNVATAGTLINIDYAASSYVSTIKIFDVSGRIVHEVENISRLSDSQINFRLPNLSAGTYFIGVIEQNFQKLGKIIVN